jgi:hypothetical protein
MVLVQPPVVAEKVYVPDDDAVAEALLGDKLVEVNPLGPVHE